MFLNIPTGDIADTVAGGELIEMGMELGTTNALMKIGKKHFGPFSSELEKRVHALSAAQKDRLLEAIMDMGSWDNVSAWIDTRA